MRNPRHQTSAALSPPQRILLEELGPEYIPEFMIPVPKRLQEKFNAAPHYTADLLCPRTRHIVEVDGTNHREADDHARDEIRRKALKALGYLVDRVTNEEVYAERNPKRRTAVQTFLFSRSRWSPTKARAWAEEHGYVSSNRVFNIGDDVIRVRQAEANEFEDGSLRTIDFGEGIKAVVGVVR